MTRNKVIRVVLIFCLILACGNLVLLGNRNGYNYVVQQNNRFKQISLAYDNNQGESPFDQSMPGAIEVIIPRSSDVSEIIDILYNLGIVKNKFFFKVLSKFNGFNGTYQAGTHYLSKEMSYDEIMYLLSRPPKPVTITFTEGLSYRQMKDILRENGIKFDEQKLDNLIRKPSAFTSYRFVQDLAIHPDREWLLQGYLWPDTYQFDANTDEETIIRTMLNNTEQKLKDSNYYERAKRMGMTMDEVITLASIVQQEGSVVEMNKIGKVFLNRLKAERPLESCASINYLRLEEGEKPRLWASTEDLRRFRDNPYNTYARHGLPPGPINSPGTIAIESILWPANESTWEGADQYYFFCAKGDGTNAFAKTLEEHEANVAKYEALWAEQQENTPANP